ncbi:MAG: hypothetical protein ACRCWI_00060 [Brevinema sp.]
MKITPSQYKKTIPHLLELFQTKMMDFDPKQNPLQRKQQSINDFWVFFENYLPHYIDSQSPKFHKEIIKLIETKQSPIVIGAPRGFSKSTLISFAYVLWNIIREKYKFIVIVSATDNLAKDLCDFIRIEFSDNRRIISDFGTLLPSQGEQGDFVVHNTRILARGRKQAIRGFRFRQYRPDLIILDDIEKDEEALSPKIVQKTLDIIIRGLLPSLKPNGKIIIVGTILRRRSVMGTLLLNKEAPWNTWTKKIYQALVFSKSGKIKSLWENRFSVQFLQKQKDIMGISAFNAEYQNIPTDEEYSLFKESYIKKGRVEESSPKIIFIDPSVDGIKNNDFKAGLLVAKDKHGIFEVIDATLIQGSDLIFFEQILAMYQKYQQSILGTYIENNSFQLYYMKDLDNYAKQQGVDLHLSGVKHYQKKELRISRLLPIFETNRILFNPEFINTKVGKILIEQLLYFPNSTIHDDAPDALAGAIDILNKINHQISNNTYQVIPKHTKKWYKESSW